MSTRSAEGRVEVRPEADLLPTLAREMGAESNLDAVWERVVQACFTQIESAEHAGITLLTGDSVSTPRATSGLVRVIDGSSGRPVRVRA